MTALAIQIDPIFYWCKKTYQRHSDLIAQTATFTLNTINVAGKIFNEMPQAIPRTSLMMLNFTGLIWLNMQIKDLQKTGKALLLCIEANDFEGIVFTALKTAVKGLNLLLSGGMLVASIASLAGFSPLAAYAFMQPFGLFSLLAGIGISIYDYEKNGALAKKIEQLENTDGERFLNYIKGDMKVEDEFSRHLYCQLDPAELDSIEENRHSLLKIREALMQRRFFTQANFGLIVVGYIGLGVCRIWPDTLVQTLVVWGISLFYTGKLVYQKITQPL